MGTVSDAGFGRGNTVKRVEPPFRVHVGLHMYVTVETQRNRF